MRWCGIIRETVSYLKVKMRKKRRTEMDKKTFWQRIAVALLVAGLSFCVRAEYRTTGTGTEPNVWTRNYSGVLSAAKQTGYPILIVIVNSITCGHCHTLNQKTLSSPAFSALENELTFYRVMVDAPYVGSDWGIVLDRYYSYFNSGMYPVIGVLRKDGSMYNSYGNRTTDNRDVTSDVRKWIEQLATEQGVDIWSGSGVTPAASVSASAEPSVLTANEWAAKLNGRKNGLLFDANQGMTGSVVLNISTRGKVSVRISTKDGIENIRASMSVSADNVPQVKAESVLLTYDVKDEVWSGSIKGYSAYASSMTTKAYTGLYTARATSVDSAKVGFLTVTMPKSGKGKVVGFLNGRNKVSVNVAAVVLPAALVARELPDWDCGSEMVFVPVVKRGTFAGGVAISAAGGAVVGKVSAFSADWTAEGSRFAVPSLKPLDGKILKIHTSPSSVEVVVRANADRRINADTNDSKIRVSAMINKGTFKGNAQIGDARVSFEGVLIQNGTALTGMGVTYGAGGVHLVTIGDE